MKIIILDRPWILQLQLHIINGFVHNFYPIYENQETERKRSSNLSLMLARAACGRTFGLMDDPNAFQMRKGSIFKLLVKI